MKKKQMEKNRKLFFAWIAFLVTIFLFVIITGVYHNFREKHAFGYHYRILIDKDLVVENEDKNQESIHTSETDSDAGFYEQTKYGYLPIITPNGKSVFDRFAARIGINTQKILRVAVLVDESNKTQISMKLNNQIMTFIIPHHINQLDDLVKMIREKGHEFFIQIPTQTSTRENKEGGISPFLANDNLENTREKLFYLLAVTKYALGIANITPTLFTKSNRDMTAVIDVLTERGAAFFDAEKSNDLIKNIARIRSLIYINPTHIYEARDFDISQLKDGDVLMIRLEHLEDLMKKLPRDWTLAPVSSSVGGTHATL
ncbi:MAG: divergent polysaccharide deacetylase family protein [Holosporaceae bacterium]|jgi:polysaccharide deacetylase 2 family uncharacterized protein YibQ|nr:divergent polysaccharide deacetylase family protein [Holosporaceae bacterium]